jgi:hypothetical protein
VIQTWACPQGQAQVVFSPPVRLTAEHTEKKSVNENNKSQKTNGKQYPKPNYRLTKKGRQPFEIWGF